MSDQIPSVLPERYYDKWYQWQIQGQSSYTNPCNGGILLMEKIMNHSHK